MKMKKILATAIDLYNQVITKEVTHTLRSKASDSDHIPCVMSKITFMCIGNGQVDQLKLNELVGALNCMHDQQAVFEKREEEYMEQQNTTSVVRRLTPRECERLQGFPDDWTNIGEWTDSYGKKHKEADSPRYKALGNSIALPFWQFLARRICAQYERDITMGSLFDGIGGFPLVFERCGAKAVWASEIEEFPIAVTKKHFPEPEDEEGAEQ